MHPLTFAFPPHSVISIVNTAGAGSLSDTFVYTAALSTVAPTGNVTISPTGAAATQGNLQPDPKNLQVRFNSVREGLGGRRRHEQRRGCDGFSWMMEGRPGARSASATEIGRAHV